MGRIKIGDLEENNQISREEMHKVLGGIIINDMNMLWTRPTFKIKPTYKLKYESIGPISITNSPISIVNS